MTNRHTTKALTWAEVDKLLGNLVRLGSYGCSWERVAPEFKILYRIGRILWILESRGYWDSIRVGDRELRYVNSKHEILVSLITGRTRVSKLR
jgi:hypothetical protein